MKRRNIFSIIFGTMLLLCGLVSLVINIIPDADNYVNLNILWPGFVLLPGIGLWISYLFSKDRKGEIGLLIPANIMTFIGLTLFVNMIVSELLAYPQIWAWTVFMYPGSVAIAFWVAWAFDEQENPGLVIPAVILSVISLLTFCSTLTILVFTDLALGRVLGPLIIIFVGLLIVFTPLWSRASNANQKIPEIKTKPQAEEGEIISS